MEDTTTGAPRQTYRQRSPIVLAVVFGLCAVLMLFSAVRGWSAHPAPVFTAWLVFASALVWAVFVRPSVVLEPTGVRLRNILRDVHIPWSVVTDVEARWNVRVHVQDKTHQDKAYTAWAISSQAHRPKSGTGQGGLMVGLMPSRLSQYAAQQARDEKAPAQVTARSVAEAIEETKADYAAAVDEGVITPPAHPAATTSWFLPAVVALGVPLVAAVAQMVR